MSGTVIPDLTGIQFANRIADLFPRDWSSDDAKQNGNVFAAFLAVGNKMRDVLQEIQYAAAAQRMQTETAPELDLASVDFLGNALPRPPGMSDADFAQLILNSLFKPAATRSALQNALTQLTGVVPRMLEPWNIFDTGVWGNISYWNVDTVANPARWGNGGLRYQGFIETVGAPIPAIGTNNPILTWGTAYWNVPGYFFGIISANAAQSIDDLINRIRAYGTIVWIKVLNAAPPAGSTAVPPSAVGNLVAVASGPDRVTVTWSAPTTGTGPFSYMIQFRVQGTTQFQAGISVSGSPAVLTGLSAGTTYELQVVTRNSAGAATSNIETVSTFAVAPAPATNLLATQVQATAVTLTWNAPAFGTPPFNYTVQFRVTGTLPWFLISVGSSIGVTIIGLQPSTEYDFEVVTTNV